MTQVEMEDEFLMTVTEVCADPASQQSEKQVSGFEMSWKTEGGRLVCRWIDSQKGEKRNYHAPGFRSHINGSKVRAGKRTAMALVKGSMIFNLRDK
jgi:hypothetical protein